MKTKSRSPGPVKKTLLDIDDFAWKLADHLYEDFRPFVSDSFSLAVGPLIKGRKLSELRAMKLDFNVNPYELKCTYQLLDLFKKFTFSNDVFTNADLEKSTKERFFENQTRLAAFVVDETPLIKEILDRARRHIDSILGDFDHFEIMEKATFGKKSSVGIAMKDACEGARWDGPITGSVDHIIWFDKLYSSYNRPGYKYAQARAKFLGTALYSEITQLKATLVPKTWKSLRMITPNTTIGTLYTSGLGKTFEDKLRKIGLDIKVLQPIHGELARQGSIDGKTVTADQKDASDNITLKLTERLFSTRWADALSLGRIGQLEVEGTTIQTETFCGMGIGFTFPFQCLVFYTLLLAIRDHLGLGKATVVSVFGDDLIYAKEMHDLTVDIFPKLGLVINVDKTFAEGRFRESCGKDYFAGLEVRPFHLKESPGTSAPKRAIEAFLYKTINGLRRRWNDTEIPLTLAYVLREVVSLKEGATPFQVPHNYPDTAGVKAPSLQLTDQFNFARTRTNSNGSVLFDSLAFVPRVRAEHRSYPYLMRQLRSVRPPDKLANLAIGKVFQPNKSMGKHYVVCALSRGSILEPPEPLLQWLRRDNPNVRGFDERAKAYLSSAPVPIAVIPQQDNGRYQVIRSVSVNWRPFSQD